MKIGIIFSLVFFIIGVVMSILQLWFGLFEYNFFIKMILTLGVLIVLSLVISLALRDYFEEKDLKKEDYLR